MLRSFRDKKKVRFPTKQKTKLSIEQIEDESLGPPWAPALSLL